MVAELKVKKTGDPDLLSTKHRLASGPLWHRRSRHWSQQVPNMSPTGPQQVKVAGKWAYDTSD